MDREELKEKLLRASVVCARSLRANLRRIEAPDGRARSVLVAGAHQFHSVWTRDFCFAAGGLLLINEGTAVRDTLDELLRHQREDGLLPRLLDSYVQWLRFVRTFLGGRIRLKAPLVPNFYSDHFVTAVDSNALVVWTAVRYALRTDSLAWAGLVMPALERAMGWYDSREERGFVRQPPYSDWKDQVGARRGAVFYTQLLRWKAMLSMEELCRALGRGKAAQHWKSRAKALARRTQARFWDSRRGFFADTQGSPLLSSGSNLLAASWGFADADQRARILRSMDRACLMTPWGPKAGERYPLWRKGWLSLAAGIPGYQDDYVWLWIVSLSLRVLHRMGKTRAVEEIADNLVRLLESAGKVSEVYRPEDGREVRTWLYRSERPFSWSSGMLLEAFHELSRPRA